MFKFQLLSNQKIPSLWLVFQKFLIAVGVLVFLFSFLFFLFLFSSKNPIPWLYSSSPVLPLRAHVIVAEALFFPTLALFFFFFSFFSTLGFIFYLIFFSPFQ